MINENRSGTTRRRPREGDIMRMKENENYPSTKVVDRETQSMREREIETCRRREQESRTKNRSNDKAKHVGLVQMACTKD